MDIIRTKGFALRVHWAGLALLGLALLAGQGRTALAAVLALLAHEGCHLLALWLLKAPVQKIELTPFGGVMEVESFQSLPGSHRICIAAAGVLGSLLLGLAARWAGGHGVFQGQPEAFFLLVGRFSLMLAFWNAFPILPMDGGQVLAALCDPFPFGQKLRKALMLLGMALGVALVGLAAYGAWMGQVNVTLLVAGPYVCYAARQAYVTGRMRLVEQKLFWQAQLKRGATWKVDGTAFGKEISKRELVKAVLELPGNRLHYFFQVDPHSGKVLEVLQEPEMIAKLMDEKEE